MSCSPRELTLYRCSRLRLVMFEDLAFRSQDAAIYVLHVR